MAYRRKSHRSPGCFASLDAGVRYELSNTSCPWHKPREARGRNPEASLRPERIRAGV